MALRGLFITAAAAAFVAGCGNDQQMARPLAAAAETDMTADRAERAVEDGRLVAFLDTLWEERVALSPEYQTRLGRKTSYDQWDDRSQAAERRYAALLREQLDELRSGFVRDALSPEGQLNYDLFIANTENTLALNEYRLQRFDLNQYRGIHTSIPVFLRNDHAIDTISDAESYIARVSKVDAVLAQAADRLERQVAADVSLPEFSYPMIADSARNAAGGDDVREDFVRKIKGLGLTDDERDRLVAELDAALEGPYRAGYEDFAERVEVLAEKTEGVGDFGVSRFENGKVYYAALLRNYLTTDIPAEEIHQTGLQEVERIQNEMRAIMDEVGFEGTLEDFFAFMRDDEQFYLPNTDEGRAEYLALARSYIAGIEGRLDELFGMRPSTDVEVRRVEPFREKAAGKAFYNQPDPDGTRPGYFYANLAGMENMPTYQLEALVYHEAIPGHHMQRGLQIEQDDLPKFRRFGNANAYTEGWGLYSELLPKEIGFYEDPYSDFGRLAMELWRATRMVVDTGIHAKGWDLDRAVAYLQENTPNPPGDTVKAIQRYMVIPGQAPAYKVGMMRILELREEARRELGDDFDIRAFHDAVLRSGPLPLDVLEQQVDRWIENEKNRRA